MQPTTASEKELLKENLYRTRIQDILRKHRGFLTNYPGEASSDTEDASISKKQFAPERSIIDKIVSNESISFFSGIALGAFVFASVRYAPRYLAVRIGGQEKEKALKDADERARKANTKWVQQVGAFLIEASFGAWAGWRGYNILSSQNKDSYEQIAKIPLCAGRSLVSEKVCSEWVDLVYKEIPSAFWQNLDGSDSLEKSSKLKDPRRWMAVRDFADNCIKRTAYEDSYRKQHGLSSATPVELPNGVPNDILLSLQKKK